MEEIRLQPFEQLTGIPVISWNHKSQRNRLRKICSNKKAGIPPNTGYASQYN